MTDLSAQLSELLASYESTVTDAIGDLIEDAAKELVAETKRTAPYANHGENAKRRRHYRNAITYTRADTGTAKPRCIWHVKGADYRLTHLLVHGHQSRDGSRVKGNTFLQDACDKIFPELEKRIEEAIKQ